MPLIHVILNSMRSLRILLIALLLLIVSLGLSVLGGLSAQLVGPLLFIILIAFPGKDRNRPRLIRWIPWLWGLSAGIAGILLGGMVFQVQMMPPDALQPSLIEILLTLVWAPILIRGLIGGREWILSALVLSAITFSGSACWTFSQSVRNLSDWIDLIGALSGEILAVSYFFYWKRVLSAEKTA